MIGYYMYHTYMKVAVGQVRQQIELNKEQRQTREQKKNGTKLIEKRS